MIKSLLSIYFVFSASAAFAQVEGPVREFYSFEVPGLPATGPAFVSWFFIRGGDYWGNGEFVVMRNAEWPVWDSAQIPLMLVPPVKQKSFILIYDSERKFLQEIELKEPFSPEAFFEASSVKPGFYQIRTLTAQNHLELTSPMYPWYQKKKIATCDVDISDPEFNAKKSGKLKLCMSTLMAYTSSDNTDERQFYVHIEWPSIKGRENIMAIKEMERELRAGARKKKMIFLATKGKGTHVKAEVGLTLKENLPTISFPVDLIGDIEKAEVSPDTKTVSKTLHEETFDNGAKYKVLSFYSDAAAKRQLESPRIGRYQITLQFVDGSKSEVVISQTRTFERRTGILGFMRPLQLLASGGLNLLSSSRGEDNAFFGFPAVELRYNWKRFETQPYLSFEKQLLHAGSSLQITEVRAGASRELSWFDGAFYSFGYQEYTLSGKNEGATRLGGITALSGGLGVTQKFENWVLRGRLDLLIGNSQSFDFRLDAGKYFGSKTDSRYYLGPYLGFANYRGYVVNKLKNRELFSENRLQIGFMFGWMGPDSF